MSLTPETNRRRELFKGLEGIKQACGPKANKHDLVMVLIAACIDEGVNTGAHIVGTLRQLGFNARHVGRLLNELAGNNPKLHDWCRDENGTYSLLS